ncbi:protein NUCLEOLAR FACTOR 1 [Andrographis paniculata]|uniref:protein NUCLEOLAR FACTOR 1 n=1 Tax=Andrographis paniculata TaxID=175694 RepID=UPI0021E9A15C|nr:protein NUCLEOLAR FACTOR 1 [Andrographis paniculata]
MKTLKRHRPREDDAHRKSLGRTAKWSKKGGSGFEKTSRSSANAKKKLHVYEEKDDISEDFSEEQKNEDSEAEDVAKAAYREPSMYDNLLKRLGSGNLSVANALRRRQREEQGQSDTDEDVGDDSDPLSDSEEIDGHEDGEGNKSPMNYNAGSGSITGLGLREDVETNGDEDDLTASDDALSDTDEEGDLGVNNQHLSEASATISNFDSHLTYKLESVEVDNILKRKWRYTWTMPALNMPNCNWKGTGSCFMKDMDTSLNYGLKTKLYKHWLESYKESGGSEFHQSRQRLFFSICNSYYDILHHNKKPFYLRGLEEESSIMDAYVMHCLNHIFISRDLMVKNERKLAKQQESAEEKSVDCDAYLDRGFTRPKVLILLPLAGIARRVVKKLIQLTPPKYNANVENLERFHEEFGSGRESKDDGNDAKIPNSKKSAKPPDFQALLGNDNDNDHFMLGIKFTSRGIKLYGDFYTSDVIVSSPLGLITKIGEAEVDKEKDVDYLSSIEVLVVDHADVMLMQNWSHVNTVIELLNRLPSKQHGADIMRIRQWYLDGQARFYRQTVILSSHPNPDINALFNKHCLNYRGKVKLECKYKGVLPKILIQARQIYERLDISSIEEADEARFKYFCDKVFPKIKDSVQDGMMIFISSYFEFVRIRNYLKSQAASVCLFGEYIQRNDISRVRGEFFRGEKKIILYTERAHFYYRYKIRGVKNLIFYSLPERKEFYPEIVNLLEESDSMNCRVLFSRLDHLRLERIVGSAAAKRMIDSDKGVFVFA